MLSIFFLSNTSVKKISKSLKFSHVLWFIFYYIYEFVFYLYVIVLKYFISNYFLLHQNGDYNIINSYYIYFFLYRFTVSPFIVFYSSIKNIFYLGIVKYLWKTLYLLWLYYLTTKVLLYVYVHYYFVPLYLFKFIH